MSIKQSFQSEEHGGCAIFFLILLILPFIGWLMNFQNLWQYWPDTPNLSVLQFFEVVSIRWLISLVGVFIPPVGAITGFIW